MSSGNQAPQPPVTVQGGTLPLEPGDRLTRAEFERRYEAMRGVKKAELIEGVVYMPSAVRLRRHSQPHLHMAGWLATYEAATPGVVAADNSTVRLDPDNEPQPDLLLLVDPAHGGQARISEDDYVEGAPELVVEIASSSSSYDTNVKRDVYRRSGVREYIVWRVLDRKIDWFVERRGAYELIPEDQAGLLKSEAFPGLWLNGEEMLGGDLAAVLATLARGLGSDEHRAFLARLAALGPSQ